MVYVAMPDAILVDRRQAFGKAVGSGPLRPERRPSLLVDIAPAVTHEDRGQALGELPGLQAQVFIRRQFQKRHQGWRISCPQSLRAIHHAPCGSTS